MAIHFEKPKHNLEYVGQAGNSLQVVKRRFDTVEDDFTDNMDI